MAFLPRMVDHQTGINVSEAADGYCLCITTASYLWILSQNSALNPKATLQEGGISFAHLRCGLPY